MIELVAQSGKRNTKFAHPIHADWQSWMDASAYTHADARRELELPNGTFYRRIAKSPTMIDRLAMAALYEGIQPFIAEQECAS